MNNWKKFCFKINNLTFSNEKEVEDRIADLLDLVFGWDEASGNLKRQVPIQIGHAIKRADIVLYKNHKKQLILEIKRPNFIPGTHEIQQLYSYMCIEKVEYGIMANNRELWIYRCPLISSNMEEVAHIPFDPEEINGQKLASLLNFDSFDLSKISSFCKEQFSYRQNESRADDLADMLCSKEGVQLIKQALYAYDDLSREYNQDIIQKAVNKLIICKTSEKNTSEIPTASFHKKNKKNRFRFSKKGLKPGDEIIFIANPNFKAVVKNNLEVDFNGETYRLSPLARDLYEKIGQLNTSGSYQGGAHFTFRGIRLIDLPDVKD